MITIKTNSKDVVEVFGRFRINLLKELNITERDIAFLIRDTSKILAPKFTGNLANKIKAYKRGKGYVVSSTARYATAQEKGYKPHVVKTANKPRLKAWAMAKMGYVPRTMAIKKFTPYLKPAIKLVRNEIKEKLKMAASKSAIKAGFKR